MRPTLITTNGFSSNSFIFEGMESLLLPQHLAAE
jgi:hypothetical protein